jgi:hypothetical protein
VAFMPDAKEAHSPPGSASFVLCSFLGCFA